MVAATARGHHATQLASRSAIVVHTVSLVQVRLVHDLIGILVALVTVWCAALCHRRNGRVDCNRGLGAFLVMHGQGYEPERSRRSAP